MISQMHKDNKDVRKILRDMDTADRTEVNT